MSADYRDLALEHLATDEAALRAQVRSLEADADAYLAVAVAALDALANVTASRERLRAEHHRLRDEYGALRESAMRDAVARREAA